MKKIKGIAISFLKLILFFLAAFLTLSVPTVTWADSGWAVSIAEMDQSGHFDYTLYYPYSSQVISKVILPQDQLIKTISLKYHFTNKRDYIRLQYGGTGVKFKGVGSDSDWTIEGSNTMTDYGILDVYGEQKVAVVDFGMCLFENEIQKVDLVVGWVRQETTNEFKNIVYRLIDGEDVGYLTQPDNGSYLDGEFEGLVIGLNQGLSLSPNLLLTTGIEVSVLSANARGHWANHDPAWNWENTGRAFGYGVDLGLQYVLGSRIQAEIGYRHHYVQADGCREILNGYLLSQEVDLELEQQGLYAALMVSF